MGNVMPYQFAEAAVLGSAMMGESAHQVILRLTEDDFDDPKHKLIASAIRKLIRDGGSPDPITVGSELTARGVLGRIGGSVFLHDLIGMVTTPLSAPYYAAIIRDAARVRRAHEVGVRLTQMTTSESAAEEMPEILARAGDELGSVPPPFDAQVEEPPTVHDLLNEDEEEEDWMIPGLIERGERIVITGSEGLGKSTVIKQLACCVAAGVNPWSHERVSRDGFRVLHIDTENSRRQTRRNYRWIGAGMPQNTAPGWQQRITLHIRTEGVNLAGRDRAWFHQIAAACSPDLIVLGPAYKLMTGLDPNKDSDVLQLLASIDEVRTRHDAAVLIEAHSPHGGEIGKRPVRPFGSSVWLRWPEIGFGFRVDDEQESNLRELAKHQGSRQPTRPSYLNLVGWRGQREDRDWPSGITWGPRGGLPWVPSHTYPGMSAA